MSLRLIFGTNFTSVIFHTHNLASYTRESYCTFYARVNWYSLSQITIFCNFVRRVHSLTFTISSNMLQWSVQVDVAKHKIYVSRDLPIVLNLCFQIWYLFIVYLTRCIWCCLEDSLYMSLPIIVDSRWNERNKNTLKSLWEKYQIYLLFNSLYLYTREYINYYKSSYTLICIYREKILLLCTGSSNYFVS